MKKFKVGDKVIVSKALYHHFIDGVIGEVKHFEYEEDGVERYNVKSGDLYQTVRAEDLRKVEEKGFKSGDKVKVIGHSYSHGLVIGSIAKVRKVMADGDLEVKGLSKYSGNLVTQTIASHSAEKFEENEITRKDVVEFLASKDDAEVLEIIVEARH